MERGELARIGMLTAGVTGLSLMRTAVEDHRINTHESLEAPVRVEQAMRFGGAHLTNTKRWAAVHTVHHSTPDANLFPFVELADLVDFGGVKPSNMPETMYGMDPVALEIDTATALAIGRSARTIVEGFYTPQEEYQVDDVARIFFSRDPRYFYEDKEIMDAERKAGPMDFDPDNPPNLVDIRFLLRDPHSPVLHRQGIPGILRYNVSLYGYAETHFQQEAFMPEYLALDNVDRFLSDNRGKIRLGYVALMMAAAVGTGGKYGKMDILRNATFGAASSGLAVVALIAGGNTTNALGHAGDLHALSFEEFMDGKVIPKHDGTFTTNSPLLGPMSLDEVGGQKPHHDRPDLIAYTHDKGIRGFVAAPFGKTLEAMARNKIVFKVGKNFGGDHRPDDPSEAVLMLQDYRARVLND